ncbi:ABC transporter ATP-binding protein [Egibacter rhizosphaerae]|uniref:ABC transporter ATP-binding protein n=1 Tax=Egibacter rhizosphaerae TaxID=1670831 RepID=A0A411YI19_9ACTN|nr:ABC transporter ATP-binding protein [Egibacter rhizosphaerae]QBI20863.1 ABC transporter ATP-binding protein [Egibacter rhizosphaerae]
MNGLALSDVTAGYHAEDLVLNGVSLGVPKGRTTVLIGPNGSGKSTALRVLCGLLSAREGRVELDGEDVNATPPHERVRLGLGVLPQGRSVFPSLTVRQNIELGAWTFRRDRRGRRRRVEELLDRYPVLAERSEVLAGRLSGGQQRLTEIARMMMSDPDYVLIDEPGAGLAPVFVQDVYEEIRALADEGKGVLLVDQNVRKAMTLADYVYVLELGRKRQEGSPERFTEDLTGVVREWLRIE